MGLFEKKSNANVGYAYSVELANLDERHTMLLKQLGEMTYEIMSSGETLKLENIQELITQIKQVEEKMDITRKQLLAARGIRLCDSCGTELPFASVFCNKCGSKCTELPKEVISAGKLCPKCGNSLEEGDAFCIQCGYKF